ncbi:MAG: efflux RND transporter periplasmic adaptor subunit [Nitrospirae bacterium]|nr:efflux RND transporter periplasmic adaptor subunit [Nitrospirota bacterium]
MSKRFLNITAAILILLVSINSGCARKKEETKVPAEKIVNVKAQPAGKMAMRPFIEATGSLNPDEEVTLGIEADGQLKEVAVDEGSTVSEGMVIARIDDTDYALEVKRAEAALRQTRASLENARAEFDRKKSLYDEQLVTRQQFDDVSTRLTLAEAEIERAEVAVSIAKQKLSKTVIHSPLAGVVKAKKVSAGDYVRNGAQLVTIIRNNPLKLVFSVTEKESGWLKIAQDAAFRVDTFPEKEFHATVSIIHPNLDEKTRTLQVEATVANAGGALKPGLFASVTLYTGAEKSAVTAPVTALLYEGEQVRIFVADGNMARERRVKVGKKIGEAMEIAEGLSAGEMVVTAGQQSLSDGAKINVAR